MEKDLIEAHKLAKEKNMEHHMSEIQKDGADKLTEALQKALNEKDPEKQKLIFD